MCTSRDCNCSLLLRRRLGALRARRAPGASNRCCVATGGNVSGQRGKAQRCHALLVACNVGGTLSFVRRHRLPLRRRLGCGGTLALVVLGTAVRAGTARGCLAFAVAAVLLRNYALGLDLPARGRRAERCVGGVLQRAGVQRRLGKQASEIDRRCTMVVRQWRNGRTVVRPCTGAAGCVSMPVRLGG